MKVLKNILKYLKCMIDQHYELIYDPSSFHCWIVWRKGGLLGIPKLIGSYMEKDEALRYMDYDVEEVKLGKKRRVVAVYNKTGEKVLTFDE